MRYKNKIYSLNCSDNSDNRIQVNKIKNNVTDAYAEGKISEQHYNPLNEKISDHINGNQEYKQATSQDDLYDDVFT